VKNTLEDRELCGCIFKNPTSCPPKKGERMNELEGVLVHAALSYMEGLRLTDRFAAKRDYEDSLSSDVYEASGVRTADSGPCPN